MANIKVPENEKKKKVMICLSADQLAILKSVDEKNHSPSRAVAKLIEMIKSGKAKWI